MLGTSAGFMPSQVNCQAGQGASEQHLDHAPLEAEQSNSSCSRNRGARPVKRSAKDFRPKHVVAEEHGEVQDHPHHSGRDPCQRCGKFYLVVGRLYQRATDESEQERLQKGEPGDEARRDSAGGRSD